MKKVKKFKRNLLEVTTLITPGGMPASSAREAKARADKEGHDDVQDVMTTNFIKEMTSNLTAGCPLQASRHKCSRLQALLRPRDQPDERVLLFPEVSWLSSSEDQPDVRVLFFSEVSWLFKLV